jgi:hypothetical protein
VKLQTAKSVSKFTMEMVHAQNLKTIYNLKVLPSKKIGKDVLGAAS